MDYQTTAIVLCAGLGSRIGLPEGQNKCAAAVRETSPVQYGVSSLLEAGVDQVIVVTGYASDSVRMALSDYEGDKRIRLIHNPCYSKHGCNYSLACGMEAVAAEKAGRVIIAEGDSLLHRESIQQLVSQKADAASLVREKAYVDRKRSVIAVGCKGKILRYEYDPSHTGQVSICKGGEDILGESMQLWSFSGRPLEVLKKLMMDYKSRADKGNEPMLHSGIYSINQIEMEIEPVLSRRPEDWINLNTQDDLRKAGMAEWIGK